MQLWVVACWALLALVGADECPDGRRCGEAQTCCNSPDNGYGCCPLEQAECCEDHMHCCPSGTLCDVATSSCVNASGSAPWVDRAAASEPRLSKSFRMIKTNMGEEEDNICPDLSRCPPEFSCLKALTKFGCCPLAQGVPCQDGKHCCPEDHECSADSRSCIRRDVQTAVQCSDGKSECPEGTTCCETPEGKWGCCPMPKAVCCQDKQHCCPEGTSCDVQHSKCISLTTKEESPMWDKLPARIRAEWENRKVRITAKDIDNGGSETPPEATTANQVPPSDEEVPVSSVTRAAGDNNVPCNDTASCQDNTTCCKTKTGDWACCPLPEAVCCKDFVHCCPKGQQCNLAKGTCESDTSSVPLVRKVPAIIRQGVRARNVTCDPKTSCPDDHTCCKNQTGGWGCCPLPEAVCCEDFVHCCPKGKKCDLAAQTCDGDTGSMPLVKKVPAIVKLGVRARNVTCDPTTSCPDGSTCCKNKTGGWACCPLPEAVCCDDHEHCCPSGTTCDPTATTCQGPSGSTPVTRKKPAFTTVAPATVEPTTQAQETTTTPTEPDEEWKVGDEGENTDLRGRVRCDEHTTCPEGTTCCFIASSHKWGCCPLPEAVCCADGSHCCPSRYKCDEQQTSCVKGEVVIPWYTKLQATTDAHPSSEQCDESNRCPEHTSCCQLSTGEWGCCPMQNAVCCPDQEHCCPQGYTCNEATKSCQKLHLETISMTPVFLPKTQARPSPSKSTVVKCDDTTGCADGQTCCRTSATTWGCCPMPNAVCCSDMKHCCPNGSTCTDAGECTQDTRLHWITWHVFLGNKKRAILV